jgi:hypothetical protein
MPNKNYIRGRKFEYDIVANAKKDPTAMVFRTSGSHGPYDVIAIHLLTNEIILTQCKTKLTTNTVLKGTIAQTEIKPFGTFTVIGRKLTRYIGKR